MQLLKMKISFFAFLILFIINDNNAQSLQRFAYSQAKMGTQFKIIFYAKDSIIANEVANAAFEKIDKLNLQLSDYQLDSEINQLAKTAGTDKWVALSDELYTVLATAQKYAQLSEGSFDMTIGPLSKLWRSAIRRQVFPDRKRLAAAKQLVNYKNILLLPNSKSVQLLQKGMRLDLGGIAKGFTLDQVMKLIKGFGIQQALIDGGGDILVSDAPTGTVGWKIEKNNINPNRELETEIIYLENKSIATSGERYKYLEWKGEHYSHIIDPKTGLGIKERKQVSVIANTGMEADVLASLMSIWPIEKIDNFCKKNPNIFVEILQEKEEAVWEYIYRNKTKSNF